MWEDSRPAPFTAGVFVQVWGRHQNGVTRQLVSMKRPLSSGGMCNEVDRPTSFFLLPVQCHVAALTGVESETLSSYGASALC